MSRPPRLHVPGGFYHVTMRGNHRKPVFFRPADRRILESIVANVVHVFEARVHGYCWMTNHIHLLLQVADIPLGRIMLRVASQYARTVQARMNTTGHLFERRYHAVLIDHDSYLLAVLRYIHQNPLRAGMVQALSDYRWSSHAVYAGTRTRQWVHTDLALSMLHPDRSQAVASYLRWIGEPADAKEIAPHQDDARILGSDKFLSKIQHVPWKPRSTKSLDELLGETCERFKVTIDQLRSPRKDRALSQARAWFAKSVLDQRIASGCAVARALCRHEASIRELVRRYSSS